MEKHIQDYHYRLDDLLGSGFSSTVFRGLHRPSARQVAIKKVEIGKLNDIEQLLLRNQIRALTTIRSPFVLQTQNILKTPNNFYIVTQYCQGGDLSKRIKKSAFAESQALALFACLVEGYIAIATAGCIHRDLKSSNILLKGNQPRIGDFGFCDHVQGEKAQRFYNVGSPAYMSPEAYFDTEYSCKSDIWALGVILHQMLTQKTILRGQYNSGIAVFQEKGLVNLQGKYSPHLLSVLKGCLDFNVETRLTPEQLLRQIKTGQAQLLVSPSSPHMLMQTMQNFRESERVQRRISTPKYSGRKQHAQLLKPITISPFKFRHENSFETTLTQLKIVPLLTQIRPKPLTQREALVKSPALSAPQVLIPITLIRNQQLGQNTDQSLKPKRRKFSVEYQTCVANIKVCELFMLGLKNLRKFRATGSDFRGSRHLELVLIKLANLKMNELAKVSQGLNPYCFTSLPPFNLTPQYRLFQEIYIQLNKSYKQDVLTLGFPLITESEELNFFLLTVSELSQGSIKLVRRVIHESALRLVEWIQTHPAFLPAQKTLKNVYRVLKEFDQQRRKEEGRGKSSHLLNSSREADDQTISTIRSELSYKIL